MITIATIQLRIMELLTGSAPIEKTSGALGVKPSAWWVSAANADKEDTAATEAREKILKASAV
jgi:hypothetical protein